MVLLLTAVVVTDGTREIGVREESGRDAAVVDRLAVHQRAEGHQEVVKKRS